MMERRDLLNNKTIKDCRLICSHAQTSGNVDEHMNWKFIYIMISTWAAQRDKTLGDNDDMSSFWITDYTQNWKVYIHVTFSPKRQNEIIFDNLLGHLLVDYEKIFIAFFHFSILKIDEKFPCCYSFHRCYIDFPSSNLILSFFPSSQYPKNKIRTRLRFRISS